MGGVNPNRLRWGACAWLLTLQFFVVETIAEARFEGGYSRADDVISVLGAAESAARQLMNASFVVQGALILAGALLLRPALSRSAAQVAPVLLGAAAPACCSSASSRWTATRRCTRSVPGSTSSAAGWG